jgi:hypothetical protein
VIPPISGATTKGGFDDCTIAPNGGMIHQFQCFDTSSNPDCGHRIPLIWQILFRTSQSLEHR